MPSGVPSLSVASDSGSNDGSSGTFAEVSSMSTSSSASMSSSSGGVRELVQVPPRGKVYEPPPPSAEGNGEPPALADFEQQFESDDEAIV